jgi:hypothetical protein
MATRGFPWADGRYVEWQVPPFETDAVRRKAWVDELIQNGDRWLKGLKSISHINDDVKLLMGGSQNLTVESNTLQSDVRTFVETISDLRQIATYGSKAQQFKKFVETYNGCIQHIFIDSKFAHKSRKALQYAVLGRGYLWVKYSKDHYGWGKGRIVFDPLGPLEVIPEQLPADNDLQGAYCNTVIRPMPIAECHARFPAFQDQLLPISRFDWKSYGTLSMANRLDFYDRWRFGAETTDWDNRYGENRYTYIRDLRINNTGRKLQMGAPGATWGYEVPSLGDQIVSINPFNGLPQSREAGEEDCRLYPNLRLIITNPTVKTPMYDGPAFDMHGEMPLVEYDVNDWPWSPLGYSLIHGVSGLEKARRRLLSRMHEVTEINLDPPLGYDLHSGVSRVQMEKIDLLRSQGYRVGTNGDPRKALQSVLPDTIRVNEADFKQKELLDAEVKNTLGLNDLVSMRDLKMNVSAESFDKIIEGLGPIAKGIAENMGVAHNKIAHMLKYMIPQYFTVAEIMAVVGADGISMQTFDYDPNNLIPSHLPGELETEESKYALRDRAKWFADQLAIVSIPTQLLNVTQQQEQMKYMMFLQRGAPIPMATIMEKLGVQNYGTPTGDTEYEKWKTEQVDKLVFEFKAKLLMAAEMQAAGIQQPGQPGQPGAAPPQPALGAPPPQPQGRQPTDQAPPRQEMRGTTTGNPRVVLSTSK